ncbi:unnamed protein product, partial [Didymodactylos carnosus]
ITELGKSITAARRFFDLFEREPAIDNCSTQGKEIYIDGHDIKKLNLQWLRSKIGLVSQEPTLFDMTVQENIAYGDHGRKIPMVEIIEAAKKANIHDFIQLLPQVSALHCLLKSCNGTDLRTDAFFNKQLSCMQVLSWIKLT